ncbi:hypothetical protein FRX31_010754 [Thalictrum thalictroides]|uniref:Uncharacterized protein n=1 Tax=Thalictrum thalictroides TaxID=46969 RepID=A0A7J6WS34_THATH|nr:hypothetical protein FRX31_010754 [Thalictrum thalictroides]
MISKYVRLIAKQSKARNFSSAVELDILEEWGIPLRGGSGFRVRECQWYPPFEHTVNVNTDGDANHLSAMEIAIKQGRYRLWIETDSEVAMIDMTHDPPWDLKHR